MGNNVVDGSTRLNLETWFRARVGEMGQQQGASEQDIDAVFDILWHKVDVAIASEFFSRFVRRLETEKRAARVASMPDDLPF